MQVYIEDDSTTIFGSLLERINGRILCAARGFCKIHEFELASTNELIKKNMH